MKRVRVGVIGCGVMGGFHVKQYSSIPEAELVGVSDIDPSRAPSGVRFFHNHKELLELCDAVSITTPTFTHSEVGMDALNAGCHVLIEKPISQKSPQAKELIKKARAGKLLLAVGHIERFNPAFIAMAKEIKRRGIDLIDIKRFSPFPDRINDVSCVIDMMIHDIDLARKIAGSEVIHINASGKKVRSQRLDQALAVIAFKNGCVANIESNRVYNEKVRCLKCACGDTMFEADLLNKKLKASSNGESKEIATEQRDQLNAELRDFIGAIFKKKSPSVTGEDGLAALEIAEEIERMAS